MRISDWSSDVCSSDLTRSRPNDSLRRTGGRKSGRRFSGTSDRWVAAVGHSRSINSFALPNLSPLQRNNKAQTMTRLVALDTETTGIKSKEGDRIDEIAKIGIATGKERVSEYVESEEDAVYLKKKK